MAKKKTRRKSKLAEMGKVILENNERIYQEFAVAVGIAEYVEDEPVDILTEPIKPGAKNEESVSDTNADAADSESGVTVPGTINLQTKPAGRRRDKDYDEASRKIADGMDEIEVYEWWYKQRGIEEPGKAERDMFKKALKRRQKGAENGT